MARWYHATVAAGYFLAINDIGDGWEREGENHAYFEKFSEKKAYPIGINLVIYLLTH